MLDPITSLLAVCANCNQPDASSASHPPIAVCNTEGRSTQSARQSVSNTPCISPPETASNVLNSRRVKAAVVNQPQIDAAPSSPEAVAFVSWSNSTGDTIANATPSSASGKPHSTSDNRNNQQLQLGSRGQAVSYLQSRLRQLGYAAGAIDGVYGQQTRTAVAQFQRSNNLPADGVVGAKTWAVLQSAGSPRAETSAAPQANPETNRLTAQTPQPAAPIAAPAVVPAETSTQTATPAKQTSDESSQAGFNYLWVLGWVIIYGYGWFFILKDTLKEIRGFHFVMITNRKPAATDRRVAQSGQSSKSAGKAAATAGTAPNHAPPSDSAAAPAGTAASDRSATHSQAQPAVHAMDTANQTTGEHINSHSNSHSTHPAHPVGRSSSQFVSEASDHTNAGHASTDHTNRVEQLALLDPWQEEIVATAPETLQIAWANDGQIQPLQNVFVVAPRPTAYKRRTKKPTLIYDTKQTRQRVKTG